MNVPTIVLARTDAEAANLLSAYRDIRRNIKFAPNGKRYGASEAYAVTQNAKL